ncbi:unnamed protein product [Strongylus vulgaris]|uniref:Uncharacterized protein n=1 Tax=Strongylus vulgaris TaxID=40348 RepID=A0A3P7J1L6_STRVU|nr:unnamed protein product [Strongylus vulgaris]
MKINRDPPSPQRQCAIPSSPVHDEVSSSSDVFAEESSIKVSNGEHELATASMWAETHDFGIDGDEFLETEDDVLGSLGTSGDSEVIDLTSEKPTPEKVW